MLKQMSNRLSQQRGATLLEVMISVLVLSIGLLGIAGLQSSTLKNTISAQQRTAAVTMATSTAERIRAYYLMNRQNLSALNYKEFDLNKICTSQAAPTGTNIFQETHIQLFKDMAASFGVREDNCVEIKYMSATKSILITVTWVDASSQLDNVSVPPQTVTHDVRVHP